MGHQVKVTDKAQVQTSIANADVIIVNKNYSSSAIDTCLMAQRLGKKVVVDICDDLSEGWRDHDLRAFLQQCQLADRIVTTGPELLRQIEVLGVPRDKILIVPDIAEDQEIMKRVMFAFPSPASRGLRSLRTGPAGDLVRWLVGREGRILPDRKLVVWFGTAGREGSGVGIESLGLIADALAAVNEQVPLQLVVITRGYKAFRRATAALRFPCVYREWSLLGSVGLISQADVCVIPNPRTQFALAKSPNRCLLALNCGVPVVASRIPSIEEFEDTIVLDDWNAGLLKYLRDRSVGVADATAGRKLVQSRYGEQVIGEIWDALLRALTNDINGQSVQER